MSEYREFAKCAILRAIRTMCQTAVALVGTNAIGVSDVDWMGVASGAALSGVLSILTAIATGLPEVPDVSADDTIDLGRNIGGE